jgi:hypothetical protein
VEVECSQRESEVVGLQAGREGGRRHKFTTGVGPVGGQIVNGGWSMEVGQETRAIEGSGSWEIALMCVPCEGPRNSGLIGQAMTTRGRAS